MCFSLLYNSAVLECWQFWSQDYKNDNSKQMSIGISCNQSVTVKESATAYFTKHRRKLGTKTLIVSRLF